MPTYSVAFIVCEFGFITDSTGTVSVYARENAVNYLDYSLEVAIKSLQRYAVYTNITFPLPKLDIAPIPNIWYGGVESYGLIVLT